MNIIKYFITFLLFISSIALAEFSYKGDLDEAQLNKKFANGALANKAHLINEAAKINDVDVKLLVAVMALESDWGKSNLARTRHNYAGIRIKGKYHTFPDDTRCIYYTAELFARKYKSKSLVLIGKRYSGSSDWAKKVKAIYGSL